MRKILALTLSIIALMSIKAECRHDEGHIVARKIEFTDSLIIWNIEESVHYYPDQFIGTNFIEFFPQEKMDFVPFGTLYYVSLNNVYDGIINTQSIKYYTEISGVIFYLSDRIPKNTFVPINDSELKYVDSISHYHHDISYQFLYEYIPGRYIATILEGHYPPASLNMKIH